MPSKMLISLSRILNFLYSGDQVILFHTILGLRGHYQLHPGQGAGRSGWGLHHGHQPAGHPAQAEIQVHRGVHIGGGGGAGGYTIGYLTRFNSS